MARKLAVRLYWMLRLDVDYTQLIQVRMQDSSGHSVVAVETVRLSGHPASQTVGEFEAVIMVAST